MCRACLAWEDGRPRGEGYFAQVNGAGGIDGNAMRCDETTRRSARGQVTEARQQRTLAVQDADSRPEIWELQGGTQSRTGFAHVKDRRVAASGAQSARTVQVAPLSLKSTAAVEHLDAMILAIGYIHPTIRVTA